MENELYHHGVKGQKWGVRRYQNKDGSLTLAGKKRALKMQDQYTRFSNNKKYRDKDGNLTYAGRKKALKMKESYSELTGKQLKKYPSKSKPSTSSEPKQKSISEMSNQEIQDKIDRIRLENTLKSLTPEKMSAGQKFTNGMKNAAISIAKDKGTKIVGDLIDKKLRETLGLNNKQAKSASEILREQAQDYDNRKKVDQGQQYFKEGKYATKTQESASSSKPSESSKSKDLGSEALSKAKDLAGKAANKADQMYKDSVANKSAKVAVSNSKSAVTQYQIDAAREKEKVSNALDQIYARRKDSGKMTPEYYKIMQRHGQQSMTAIDNKYNKKIADYIDSTISESKSKSYESQKSSIKDYNKSTTSSQRKNDSMYYSDMVKALEEYKKKQK